MLLEVDRIGLTEAAATAPAPLTWRTWCTGGLLPGSGTLLSACGRSGCCCAESTTHAEAAAIARMVARTRPCESRLTPS